MTLQPLTPMTLRDRTTWHLGANAPVAAYLTSLVAISLVNRYVPETHWLLVHLLLLGAAEARPRNVSSTRRSRW